MKLWIVILSLLLFAAQSAGIAIEESCAARLVLRGWGRHNRHGVFVKYNPETRVIFIAKNQRVVFAGEIHVDQWLSETSFESQSEWFDAFARSLRVGEAVGIVEPFGAPGSRSRHFSSHGGEFGLESEVEYEEAAMDFARSEEETTISFTFFDPGSAIRKRVKFDVLTDELLILNERRGNVITYYRVNEWRKKAAGYTGSVDYVLSKLGAEDK